jgi:outer membrane protein assembly factor BamB
VFAFNASTGALVWSYKAGSSVIPLAPSLAVANGVVYVGLGQSLYGLNARTGVVHWSLTTHSFVHSSPTVANGKMYICMGESLWAFGLP